MLKTYSRLNKLNKMKAKISKVLTEYKNGATKKETIKKLMSINSGQKEIKLNKEFIFEDSIYIFAKDKDNKSVIEFVRKK